MKIFKRRVLFILFAFLLGFNANVFAETQNSKEVPVIKEGPYNKDDLVVSPQNDPSNTKTRIAKSQFYYPVNKSESMVTQIGNSGSHAPGYAIDIASYSAKKIDIRASAAGVVESITDSTVGYGKHIFIRHNNGYKTLYAHLSSFNVSKGDIVYTGQKIGNMGTTGASTGVHLHFELRYNNSCQNLEFIRSHAYAQPLDSDKYVSAYYSNDNKKTELEFSNGKIYTKTTYNSSGVRTNRVTYYTNGNWKENVDYKSNGVDWKSSVQYNTAGKRVSRTIYQTSNTNWKEKVEYKSNGVDWKIAWYYNTNGVQSSRVVYQTNNTNWKENVEYKPNGVDWKSVVNYNEAGKRVSRTIYQTSNTNWKEKVEYKPNGVDWKIALHYNTNGVQSSRVIYQTNNLNWKENVEYKPNGVDWKSVVNYNEAGKRISRVIYQTNNTNWKENVEYKSNGVDWKSVVRYNEAGKRTSRVIYQTSNLNWKENSEYHPDGVNIKFVISYNLDGVRVKLQEFDVNGTLIDEIIY